MSFGIATRVHAAVAAVCPIQGVFIGDTANKASWRIDFDKSATVAQRNAAANVIAAFVPTTEPEPNLDDKLLALEAEVADLKARLTKVEK